MPRTEEKYIVALDIGTSKVCVLVGEINDRNQIEIIGKGTSPMKGTRRGNIINLDQAVDAVKKAVDEAEVMAVEQSQSGYVGVRGGDLYTCTTPADGVVLRGSTASCRDDA